MAVSSDQWPLFLYRGYNYDLEDPWNGLFKSSLLVFVRAFKSAIHWFHAYTWDHARPISIFSPHRVLLRRNLRPLGWEMQEFTGCQKWCLCQSRMLQHRWVTITWHDWCLLTLDVHQVRFSLSSSPVFSRTDSIMDLERFYNSVVEMFDDSEEVIEVNELIAWWNRYVHVGEYSSGFFWHWFSQIFPNQLAKRPACKNSALAKIKEKCAEHRALEARGENQ